MPMYTHETRPGALPLYGALEADIEVRLDPGPDGRVSAHAMTRLHLQGHTLHMTQDELHMLRDALAHRIIELRATIADLQREGLQVFIGPLNCLPAEASIATPSELHEKA